MSSIENIKRFVSNACKHFDITEEDVLRKCSNEEIVDFRYMLMRTIYATGNFTQKEVTDIFGIGRSLLSNVGKKESRIFTIEDYVTLKSIYENVLANR